MTLDEFIEEYLTWTKEKKYQQSKSKAESVYELASSGIPTLSFNTPSTKMFVQEAVITLRAVDSSLASILTRMKKPPEGRKALHENLKINTPLMIRLMKNTQIYQSIEFNGNKISLFSAQWGKCGITGIEFVITSDIHCHHKIPKEYGGTDEYVNLILVLEPAHVFIHAADEDTIKKYLQKTVKKVRGSDLTSFAPQNIIIARAY